MTSGDVLEKTDVTVFQNQRGVSSAAVDLQGLAPNISNLFQNFDKQKFITFPKLENCGSNFQDFSRFFMNNIKV